VLDVGTVIEQFRAAMRERGIDVRETIIPDGVLHRVHVEGDRRGSETAWYILFADEHANGKFGCWKRYGRDSFSWSSGESQEWTPEQKREWHDKMERQRLEREQAETERHLATAERAQQIIDSAEDADDNHPYLKRKNVKAYGIKVGKWEVTNSRGEISVVSKLALLIPIRDTRKKIWSVQAIFPNSRNMLERDKDYLKDGAKHGMFFTIGKPTTGVILICEGYATGASLHEATGHAVVVAFDSGNLAAVADVVRQLFPKHIIVMCGDNDRWTLKPIENPGKYHAEAAATKVGGVVAIPDFSHSVVGDSKPTDFNDLAHFEGLEAVRRTIEEAIAKSTEEEEPTPEPPATTSSSPAPPLEGEVLPREREEQPPADDDEDDDRPVGPSGNNAFFEILGYDHDTYYIFHRAKSQLMVYDRTQFSEAAFVELAPAGIFWQRFFKGGKKGSFDKLSALEFVINSAHERGIFDPDRARGRGAWFDNGRVVYHHGNYLSIDGQRYDISAFKSGSIYEMQRALPDLESVEPLTADEGDDIVNLAGEFRWMRPVSAALLCGWMMLAPICGALRWRPHVWITGGAGSGKSTILNEFVNPLLYGHNLFAQGNTTEAGLRQKLRTDALPILFEESEQNEEKDRLRIQHVLSLIRQSSTESIARVYKGTTAGQSMEFLIRSMFCLASIQVGMKQQADLERVTILALKSKTDEGSTDEKWDEFSGRLHAKVTMQPQIGARFVKRAMTMIPKIRESIHSFSNAARSFFGTNREGDQYGALLAGHWSIYHDEPATIEDARALIHSYTWEEHRDVSDNDEGQAALSALMGSRLRASKNLEFTIYELSAAACGTPAHGAEVDKIEADALLRRYGIIVKDGYLLLANLSVELQKIMDRTTFAADWRGVLLRLPGADRNDNKTATFNGVASKCVRVPLPVPDGAAVQKSWLTAENPVERG